MNSGELKVDVPLAAVEDVDEEEGSNNASSPANSPRAATSSSTKKPAAALKRPPLPTAPGVAAASKSRSSSANGRRGVSPRFNCLTDSGGDSAAGSLEDLVNSFDEKITKVFQDYQENVSKIVPVQVRSQEEIMNECQVWWTITGNFGNMMPINWSKSTARAKHLPTLNLSGAKSKERLDGDEEEDEEEEDDIVAADLDMHALILNSNATDPSEPLKSADEVIKEIDDMMEAEEEKPSQDSSSPSFSSNNQCFGANVQRQALHSAATGGAGFSSCQRSSRMVSQAQAGRKLEQLSVNELTQILSDIELLVRELSEELISDLGVRDELEYEKELKNTFISLLLSIQSKRCCQGVSSSSSSRLGGRKGVGGRGGDTYKYLTTVIPYQPDRGAPPLASLQVLVKILKAINEDSPTVPALLTDYIIKVLCPS